MKDASTFLYNRRQGLALLGAGLAAALSAPMVAAQAAETPQALVERVAGRIMERIKADPALRNSDVARIMELVDAELMPHVNFTRMTASVVGRFWRQATPEQRLRLQQEFKTLLVRTYSGAMAQLTDQTLVMLPMRSRPGDAEVVVRSELRGGSQPIQIDYRMERTPAGWKVFDVNVLGIWLVDTFRGQFAQEINARGIDGLIATLAERNRSGSPRT